MDNGSCEFGCYMNASVQLRRVATLHDAASCSFIFSHEVEGESDVVLEEVATYTYALNDGSEYLGS